MNAAVVLIMRFFVLQCVMYVFYSVLCMYGDKPCCDYHSGDY